MGRSSFRFRRERSPKDIFSRGGNLIVLAPTTSGKTFIGEMLAATSARKKIRVLYLVPTKALAEEKAAHFTRLYHSVGIKTVLSSRDHREWDQTILSMKFHIAILVYEKLSALLVGWPQLLDRVGVVILDELQMLSDEERGGMIEILLTKVKRAKSKPRLLGLSAVLTEGEALARWLSADLLVEEKRPVPLRKGIFCKGRFVYQEHNSRQEGEERWIDLPGEDETDLFAPLAVYLGETRGEPTLLFLKDKPTVEGVAQKIAERLSLPPADPAIEELLTLEETASREFLIRLLKKGIAIHHADLPWEQRDLVERHFRSGAVRILCSTSTLAMGINCPAKNVILESLQWYHYRQYGRMGTRDLSRSLYENMAGRAGRKGFVDDFGRAILATSSPFQVKVWMDAYVRSPLEKIASALISEDLPEYLLNLIASNSGVQTAVLVGFMEETFGARALWSGRSSEKEEAIVDGILKPAIEKGVIARDEKGNLTATELGKITALKGIHLYTALSLVSWMKTTDPKSLSDLEILFALSQTEDARAIYIPLTQREVRRKSFRTLIKKEIFSQQEEGKTIFKSLSEPMKRLAYDEASAIKKTLVLSDWVTARATPEIELAHEIHSGAIKRIGEEFSWLAEAASAIAKAVGWPDEGTQLLENLSLRLIDGVTAAGLSLSTIRVRGLGRSYILKLIRAGYDSPEAVAELSLQEMKKIVPASLSERLYRHLHPGEEASTATGDSGPPAIPDSPTLLIDLRRDEVYYKGILIGLPPLTLKLLLALARKPGEICTKEELYRHLWGAVRDPDDFPYEAQLKDHKRRLLNGIKKGVSGKIPCEEIQGLIKTRARKGYILAASSKEVRIVEPVWGNY